MFNEVEGMLSRVVSGEVDNRSVGQAIDQKAGAMDQQQLAQHVQTAANNAQQNGSPDVAQQLLTLVEQHRSDPNALRSGLVSLVENNPQILQHFAPEFAKDVLGRL